MMKCNLECLSKASGCKNMFTIQKMEKLY
uniref:Uncharacterized protein n=1 Tax=Arundo donax TaxID=35708 RepID=A0A0A9QUS1_ARUDO